MNGDWSFSPSVGGPGLTVYRLTDSKTVEVREKRESTIEKERHDDEHGGMREERRHTNWTILRVREKIQRKQKKMQSVK